MFWTTGVVIKKTSGEYHYWQRNGIVWWWEYGRARKAWVTTCWGIATKTECEWGQEEKAGRYVADVACVTVGISCASDLGC